MCLYIYKWIQRYFLRISSRSLLATRSQSTFLKSQLYSTLHTKFSSKLTLENFYQELDFYLIIVDHQNALSCELTFENYYPITVDISQKPAVQSFS